MTASTTPRSGELRALFAFDCLPVGCIALPVTDEDTAPHLRLGEFAVVDTSDRAPVNGELFVIRYNSPHTDTGYRDRIVQTNSRDYRGLDNLSRTGWWVRPYVGPRSCAELEEWVKQGRSFGLSDGPYRPAGLKKCLVGRVVGFLSSGSEGPLCLPVTGRAE